MTKERISFYVDEHVNPAIVKALRLRGIDVLTCNEANMLAATDEQHLKYAHELQRTIFTQDNDFLKLHATGLNHAGIVYAHQLTTIGVIIRGILLIYQVLDKPDMSNHIEFIEAAAKLQNKIIPLIYR